MAKNLNFRVLNINSIEIGSWTPLPDGKGPPTQVHILLEVQGIPDPLLLRIKTAERCDEIIKTLQEHRHDVWG